MTNFYIIALCFVAGFFAKKNPKFPKLTGITTNLYLVYVGLPALILAKFPALVLRLLHENFAKASQKDWSWLAPVTTPWIMFFLAYGFIQLLARTQIGKSWSTKTRGALILTAGLANTSFVGFPLLEALLGPESIPVGILLDLPGSFLTVSTLGLLVAATYSGAKLTFTAIVKRVLFFPPFMALVIAFSWALIQFHFQDSVPLLPELFSALDKIGASLFPLAFFGIGFQTDFNLEIIRRYKSALITGLTLRLFVIPALIYFLYAKFIQVQGLYLDVIILEAAMATQLTSAIVAREYDLDADFANLMVTISLPISLLTVPLIHYLT